MRADRTTITNYMEQAEELLSKIFLPLPNNIKDKASRPQRAPVTIPVITIEEVKRQLFAVKSWKVPVKEKLLVVSKLI